MLLEYAEDEFTAIREFVPRENKMDFPACSVSADDPASVYFETLPGIALREEGGKKCHASHYEENGFHCRTRGVGIESLDQYS